MVRVEPEDLAVVEHRLRERPRHRGAPAPSGTLRVHERVPDDARCGFRGLRIRAGHIDDEERFVTLELLDRLARSHDAISPIHPDVHLYEITPTGTQQLFAPSGDVAVDERHPRVEVLEEGLVADPEHEHALETYALDALDLHRVRRAHRCGTAHAH